MDSTTDNSFRTLWSIVKVAGVPDYISNGMLVDGKDAESLPDGSFADTMHRRFPLTDRANTWASAGYFAKTASDYGYSTIEHDAIEARIKKAAQLYGIGNDVNDMMSKVRDTFAHKPEKKASDSDAYCDPEHNGYPVFDKEGAELANGFFEKHAYKYGHERRMSIAKNIMRKCAEFGVKVSEQVRLSAGDGYPNRETLAENLLFRANELMRRGTYKMAEELCKFAKEICICSDEDLDDNREGLFNAIGGIDEITGIDDCYDKKFLAPEEVVFDVTPSSIKDVIDDAVPMGRDTFSANALADLPRALFEKVLPKEMVDGMMDGDKISPKKLSVTIISMKSPEKTHLVRTIKDFTDGLVDVEDGGDEPEEIEIGSEPEDDGHKSGKKEDNKESGDEDKKED